MRQLVITKSITNRDNASFDKYLAEVSKEEMITAEEETVLAQKIREGDQEALDKLVKANLRFVISVAKQYQNNGLTLSDLINEGNLGLIKAAQRFDEKRGFKFISYAVWWIRQSIMQALAENTRIVRLPLNKVSDIRKIRKEFSRFEQEYEREPNTLELAEFSDWSEKKVNETLSVSGFHLSLDKPLINGEEYCLSDVLENTEIAKTDNSLINESLGVEIARAFTTLQDREREVLLLFFGIGKKHSLTLDEIAELQGLTKERVRQIKAKAIKRLRKNSINKFLKTYLD